MIDCPPSLSLVTINALVAADAVIVPLQCEFLALEGITDLIRNINQIKRKFNPKLELQGVVLTMYDKRNNLSQMVEDDVRNFFGKKYIRQSYRGTYAYRKRLRTVNRFDLRFQMSGFAGLYQSYRRSIEERKGIIGMLENEKLDDLDILGDAGKPEEHAHGGKRKSLGRGLGALLGDADFNIDEALNDTSTQPAQTPDDRVDVNLLFPSPFQPRKDFDEEALNALVESVKEKGVLQPLLVRKKNGRFEIIAGERRWRASKLAGLQTVPIIVKDMDDKEVLEVALVENLLRENLSAIEEAEGFQRLIDEFSHTQEALAQIVGKSRSHVANTLRLLNLPDPVKDLVREGTLSAGHARALVGLDNAETLAKQIVAKDLNVRQVEELVAKQKNPEVKEPKKAKDEDIVEIEKI